MLLLHSKRQRHVLCVGLAVNHKEHCVYLLVSCLGGVVAHEPVGQNVILEGARYSLSGLDLSQGLTPTHKL